MDKIKEFLKDGNTIKIAILIGVGLAILLCLYVIYGILVELKYHKQNQAICNAKKLKKGMSKKEVLKILGSKPFNKNNDRVFEYYAKYFRFFKFKYKRLVIEFDYNDNLYQMDMQKKKRK